MPPAALSDTSSTSPELFAEAGALILVFALVNAGIRAWVQRRLRAGKPLAGPSRQLRGFVERPKLFIAALSLEIVTGVAFVAVAIAQTLR